MNEKRELRKRLQELETEVDSLLSIDQDVYTVEAEIRRLETELEM